MGDPTTTAVAQRTCLGPCGQTFPLTREHFHPDGKRRDGSALYKSRCRRCVDDQRREYRKRLKEQVAAQPKPRRSGPRGAMLPAAPLGERVHRAIMLHVRATGASPKDAWQAYYERSGFSEKRVFDWRYKQKEVTATIAYEALDAVDLQLIDAYTPEQLEVLPPVELD